MNTDFSLMKDTKMPTLKKLNKEQIQKIKIFHQTLSYVEGFKVNFSEEELATMTGTYSIIEKLGGGDPIEAAKKRMRMVGSIK